MNSGCFEDGLLKPVHELLHTLGFVHEHTRPDRDKFVKFNKANVEPEKMKNFDIRAYGDASFNEPGNVDPRNTPYDVLSVLHYGPMEFSKNDQPVMKYIFLSSSFFQVMTYFI